MKKIILDTNALMAISEFKIDIFSELEMCCDFSFKLFVLEEIIDELKKIKDEQRGKYKLAAKLALSILKIKIPTEQAPGYFSQSWVKKQPTRLSGYKTQDGIKKIEVLTENGNVDDLLVEYSKEGYLVLTQDIGLKKRLKKPYLTIRQKKKIVVVE